MEKQHLPLKQIRQLATKMRAARLHEIELCSEGWSLKMRYDAYTESVALPAAAEPEEEKVMPLCAPLPGKVLLQHPGLTAAYVQPGQTVKHNELLALLKIGQLYLPLRSPADGVVKSIEVHQEQAVEYGSEIVLLTPTDGVGVAL